MYGHTNPTIRTTQEGEQIGPKMHHAVELADRSDSFRSKNELAKKVGPNSSQDYGYRIVNRCIKRGLISRPDPDHENANPHGAGAIEITEKGERYLEAHE